MPLQPGASAPDFTLKTMTAEGFSDVSLGDHKGKDNVVLFFIPAAFSGVCTDQFCDITQSIQSYKDLDAAVYGISVDSPFALQAWAEKEGIEFPLLSDYQHNTVQAYDVVLEDFAGLGPGSRRAAFAIDKQGVVRHSEATPQPTDLPDIDAIKSALKNLA